MKNQKFNQKFIGIKAYALSSSSLAAFLMTSMAKLTDVLSSSLEMLLPFSILSNSDFNLEIKSNEINVSI